MGMFSMGVGEGLGVNELGGRKSREPQRTAEEKRARLAAARELFRGTRKVSPEEELAKAIGKLTEREVMLVMHYGAEMHCALVSEFAPEVVAEFEEVSNNVVRNEFKTLPEAKQVEIAKKAAEAAHADVMESIRDGKFDV